jgi:hypothetical protein
MLCSLWCSATNVDVTSGVLQLMLCSLWCSATNVHVTSDVLQLMLCSLWCSATNVDVTSGVLQLMSCSLWCSATNVDITSDVLQLMSCDSLCWYQIIIIINLCYQSLLTYVHTEFHRSECVTLDLCDRSLPYPSQALVAHHQQMYGRSTYCKFVRVIIGC